MRETSKMHAARVVAGHFDAYLRGDGIDIGCGDDPLRPITGSVVAWDIPQGDAQVMAGVSDGRFDFVYSSHCLEHLPDVPDALRNWCRILKPGGCLYVTVPDYQLYEHHRWPSLFNPDHRHSFSLTLTRSRLKRPDHWHIASDVQPILRGCGVTMESEKVEDHGYDYNAGWKDQTKGPAVAQIVFIGRKAT
jgi:SAM-dependent methyltransferase